jgi:hypothetical protein
MATRKSKPPSPKPPSNRRIDEEVEESFPASDPPAFMGGERSIGAPKKRKSPAPGARKAKKKHR